MSGQRKGPSPFESDDAGLELVSLDQVTVEDDFDLDVTVEEPAEDDGLDFELIIEEPEPGPCQRCETVDDLSQALAALDEAEHPELVLDLLAQPVVPGASLTVVFLVRGEVAVGQRACGSDVPEEEVKGLVVPLAAPSLLHRAATDAAITCGTPQEDHTQQVISRYLRAPEPGAACVAPVVLGRRAVNLVCIQTAGAGGLDAGGLKAVGRLCKAAARSYLRQIRARKAGRD